MQYTQTGLRGKRAAAALVPAMVVVLALASSVFAAQGVMLQIKDAPLKDVVTLLTQQSGVNIVIVDESKLDKRVTVSLNDVPLEKALDYIVGSAGVSYQRMADGTYIIGGSPAEELPVLSPSDVAHIIQPVEPEPALAPRKEPIFTTIKLMHSKPSELLRLLGWNGSNPIPNCDPVLPARLSGNPAAPVTTNPGGGIYNIVPSVNLVQPTGAGAAIENTQPVPPAFDARGNIPGAGRTGDIYSGAGQIVTSPRPPGYPPIPGRPTPTPGTTTTTTTTTGQGFLWPEGVEQAQPFDLDNSIIVKGDEDGIEKFKKIVRMLDVPPKQVQIKAEFVEVSRNDVKKFGIDWSLQTLNSTFDTAFGPAGNVVVGFATGNLTAQLQAQLTSDIGRVINSPLISTVNNQNAYISINQQIPYWVTMNVISGDQIVEQSTPQFIIIDTSLDVTPRVNGDSTITMFLTPRVSDTGKDVVGPAGEVIPEQRTQELFTQRRVANGETIVVGGFIRKNDSNSIQKIPILGDLPIIGSLFRTTAKTIADRELLIFITPTIIPEVGTGAVPTGPVP